MQTKNIEIHEKLEKARQSQKRMHNRQQDAMKTIQNIAAAYADEDDLGKYTLGSNSH